jgi:hypothetical protein
MSAIALLLGTAPGQVTSTGSGTGTASVALGAASVLAALGALWLAFRQTRQLKEQITKLANTESGLNQIFDNLGLLSTNMERLASSTVAAINLPEEASHVDHLLPRVRALVKGLTTVLPAEHPFISDYIDKKFQTLITDTERAHSGSLEIYVVNLTDLAIELFELAEADETVLTTSYVDTQAFWQTPGAVPYLLTNKALIKERGVNITRIFIFNDPASLEKSEEEMDKQCDAGIKVKTVFTEELQGDLIRDMFLLDERLAAQFETTADRRELLQLRVWYDTGEIQTIKTRMDRLDGISVDYIPRHKRGASQIPALTATD